MAAPEVPKWRAKRERESLRIAAIANDLFHERGFDAVHVEDIATAAGVSRRTFFNYFDSKNDAFWEWPARSVAKLYPPLREIKGSPDPWGAILEVLVAWAADYTPADREVVSRRWGIAAGSLVLSSQIPPMTDELQAALGHALNRTGMQGLQAVLIDSATRAIAMTILDLVKGWAADGSLGELADVLSRSLGEVLGAFERSMSTATWR